MRPVGQVRYQGLGTEKLQAEIEAQVPRPRRARAWTATRCSRPGSHARVLDAFRDGEIHILLGTQMIAKGLDFPNVTLVGVVNADVGLHLADFRAAERTFQLLSQVAGRTGRGPRGGKVLVQTFSPEHPSIALAATHDYLELRRRRAGPPPRAQLSAVSAPGPAASSAARTPRAAGEFADRLAAAFEQALEQHEEARARRAAPPRPGGGAGLPAEGLLSLPLPAAVAQLRAICTRCCGRRCPPCRPPHGVEVTVDIDPQDML